MNNYEIKMNPTISKKGMLRIFEDALCGGSIGYGCITLDCESDAYGDARERVKILKSETPEDYILKDVVCYEEVMTEVLRAGGKLYYYEYGNDDMNSRVEFDLDHMMDNFENVPEYLLKQMMNHEFDSITTDNLMQSLLLGEIVYG